MSTPCRTLFMAKLCLKVRGWASLPISFAYIVCESTQPLLREGGIEVLLYQYYQCQLAATVLLDLGAQRMVADSNATLASTSHTPSHAHAAEADNCPLNSSSSSVDVSSTHLGMSCSVVTSEKPCLRPFCC
jgi:hypothetical protein